MSRKDLLRGHTYTSEVVQTEDGPRLQMTCKCGWVKLLVINSGTGTGLSVTWHVHCQQDLVNHS